MIHLYTGDGKGKTTAAVGIALRCAGSGGRILFCQFLKDGSSGEFAALRHLCGFDFMFPEVDFGFTFRMDDKTKAEAAAYYREYWNQILQRAAEESYTMIVLDEIAAACSSGLLDAEAAADFLRAFRGSTEIILTGRNPDKRLLELADYITDMRKIRHPYDRGVAARTGIER